jgi:acetoin utilization deacetylase AcuC-like enzyme
MHVYTKIKDKLAAFNVETTDVDEAIKMVRDAVGLRHKGTILALIQGGKNEVAEVG